jgi:hypothetical protein
MAVSATADSSRRSTLAEAEAFSISLEKSAASAASLMINDVAV